MKLHTVTLEAPLVSAASTEDKAAIQLRKLKQSFDQTVAAQRSEIDLLRLQLNDRVFFGVSHSAHQSATSLATITATCDTFEPPTGVVAGTWKTNVNVANGEHRQWNLPELVVPDDAFTLEDDNKKIRVAKAGLYQVHANLKVYARNWGATLKKNDVQLIQHSAHDDCGSSGLHVFHLSELVELEAGSTISVTVTFNNTDCGIEKDANSLSIRMVGQPPAAPTDRLLGPHDLPELPSDELMPLRLCTRLQRLSLRGNGITHLRFLDGLTDLTELDLADTRVVDLGPIAGLTSLKRLSVTGLVVDSTTVSTKPLEGLTSLEELSLQDSASIQDAVPIGKIKTLRKLVLDGTGVSNQNPLQQPGLVIE